MRRNAAKQDLSYVLISAAVNEELSGLTGHIQNQARFFLGRREVISGFIAGIPVQILTAGPGKVNTAQALTALIEKKSPGLIIQTGCAGVFRQSGLKPGDLAIATHAIDVELGIESPTPGNPSEDIPFAMLRSGSYEIKNCYPLNVKIAAAAFDVLKSVYENTGIEILQGPFLTVSMITATEKRAEELYEKYHPCMEEMEGSAAAHISIFYELPLLAIRAGSNFVGKRDRSAWMLGPAFERCTSAVLTLIRSLASIGWIVNSSQKP